MGESLGVAATHSGIVGTIVGEGEMASFCSASCGADHDFELTGRAVTSANACNVGTVALLTSLAFRGFKGGQKQ